MPVFSVVAFAAGATICMDLWKLVPLSPRPSGGDLRQLKVPSNLIVLIVSLVIRAMASAMVAFILAQGHQISGIYGAVFVGLATPALTAQLARQTFVPMEASPKSGTSTMDRDPGAPLDVDFYLKHGERELAKIEPGDESGKRGASL